MNDSPATVHIDGAARGNPGPAAIAFVLKRPGLPDVEHAETLGNATNNVAEYTALVAALEKAVELGVPRLSVFSDSELLVKQMNGEYKVKNEDLRTLYTEASALRRKLENVTLSHVRREQNKRADELCNIVLDGAKPKPASPSNPAKPSTPAKAVTDDAVRQDAIACLASAANAWATHGLTTLPAEAVWEQLWSILEEGGVLKKRK
jgi:ribonuclease HI